MVGRRPRMVRVGGVRFEGTPRSRRRAFVIGPEFSGWDDGPAVRRESVERPVAHGGFLAAGFRSSRVINLPGWALASSPKELYSMRDQLMSILADGSLGRMTVQGADGTTFADVALAGQPVMKIRGRSETEAQFQLQLWAPDPRKYGAAHLFTGSSVRAFHYGNFPATPEVTVVGPHPAYSITSQGKGVTVTQELLVGQTHKISMTDGWVFRNGVLQPGAASVVDVFDIRPGRTVTVTGPSSMVLKVHDTFV